MIGGSSLTSDNFGGAASGWGNKLQTFQVWAELRDIVRYGYDEMWKIRLWAVPASCSNEGVKLRLVGPR
jgi:hypothetical protein